MYIGEEPSPSLIVKSLGLYPGAIFKVEKYTEGTIIGKYFFTNYRLHPVNDLAENLLYRDGWSVDFIEDPAQFNWNLEFEDKLDSLLEE